ncbi:ATP-binding protein [Burkholderia sp. BCC0322]|uniref:ATP-binding protein n=1 Tax=unclassified Burkholderia TaxID=2613784 RepID=UPI00158AF2CC|nr:ATP-binding protein [Burkholderia sp. BCC0322]
MNVPTLFCEKHGEYPARSISIGRLVLRPSKCPKCVADEDEREQRERVAKETRARQERLERQIKQAGIPHGFLDRTFESYIATEPSQQKALDTTRRFAGGFDRYAKKGTMLALCGGLGTGKTHLAIAAAQHVSASGHTVMYTTAMDMVTKLRDAMRQDSPIGPGAMLDVIGSVDLLIVDELGVQKLSDDVQTHLFNVFDRRYRDARPALLLSNLTATELGAYVGDRIADRLRERAAFISCDWQSYRRQARDIGDLL